MAQELSGSVRLNCFVAWLFRFRFQLTG